MRIEALNGTVVFHMNMPEVAQVMWSNGLVHLAHSNLKRDRLAALQQKLPVDLRSPISLVVGERGQSFTLRCNLSAWRYFENLEATNPSEREIRAAMILHAWASGSGPTP